ncbi:MAG: polyprenyl synthetase family protein [Thermoleophilaceae bacterium]
MDHLGQVEARLRAVAAVPDGRLAELALHLIEAGGKRLRPRLVLAAAVASRGHASVDGHVIAAAVAVELLHLASLYHDDVLDAAPLRRGRPSVNAVWGDHAAVLGGDILLAHAYRVAAELRPAELLRICDTLTELCAGQIAESDAQFDRARGLDDYEQAIRGKTAALLTTSCWLGASTAGAPADDAEVLAEYGTHLGVAFQVLDDVLDLHGDGGRLGKLGGSDLREGVFTLPVLLARRADPDLDALLVEGIDEAGIAEVRARVRAVGADSRAVAFALDRLHLALSLVERGPFDPHGERLLTAMAASVLEPLDRLPLASGVGRAGVGDGSKSPVVAR